MRHVVIVLLSLGLGASANTVQQTDKPLPELGESVSKHNEEIEDISNIASEQKDSVDSLDAGLLNDIIRDNIEGVSVTIEENINPAESGAKINLATEELVPKFDLPTVYITDIPEFPVEENNFYRAADSFQDEIMDVAASWAPPPFFRTHRQKARRRFSVQRHFIPNPYRRFHYYPYHAFYRPRPYFY